MTTKQKHPNMPGILVSKKIGKSGVLEDYPTLKRNTYEMSEEILAKADSSFLSRAPSVAHPCFE